MKAFRCARCGENHQTRDCKVVDRKEFRCANCKGAHSSASPTCPAFHKVQDSWQIVAKEGKSYAEAIRSVVRQHDPEGAGRSAVNSQQRADRNDVIDTPAIKKRAVLDTPTQAMKPWLRKPTMKPAEVQTDEIQKEVAVQTCRDAECQTDFEPPVEKAQQTSSDMATQTTEIMEAAAQTCADTETQANIVDAEKEAEEHFFLATLLQIVGVLLQSDDDDADLNEIRANYKYVADKMAERGFPIKQASRRSQRKTTNSKQKDGPHEPAANVRQRQH